MDGGESQLVWMPTAWYTGVAGIAVGTAVLVVVSAVPVNVREMTEFRVLLQSTSDPTSGVRKKFCVAEVEDVPPSAPPRYAGTWSVAASEG